VKERLEHGTVEVIFQPVMAPAPWHAFRLKTSSYPWPGPERLRFAGVAALLSSGFSGALSVYPTLWLDTQELHLDGGAHILSQHSREWSTTMGFAFDPTGEPPRPLQMSDLMDVDYGTKPKIYHRSAMFVSNITQTIPASKLLAGRGLAVFLFFTSDGGSSPKLLASANGFMERSQVHLQPLMIPGAFRGFPFYLPLLSSVSMARASAQQLDTWLGDCTVYLREAFEDQEIFILARHDLTASFQSMGLRRLSAGDDPVSWSLHIESTAGDDHGR